MMATTAKKEWAVHAIEVNGKWSYILEKLQSKFWNGHVSDTLFETKETALAAGFAYIAQLPAK